MIRSGARPRLTLALLTLTILVSFLDRTVLSIVIEPVKHDLGLSDTQIGWLVGFAFSAIYAILGVPVARLADRGLRRNVIVASLLVWSVMTALCGRALNFSQLFAARVGVGMGEAGSLPAAQSMVSSIFPYERRSLALAILGSGGGLGIMVAFALGAKLEHAIGWRETIMVVSIPGAILALLIAVLVREPPPMPELVPTFAKPTVMQGGGVRQLLLNRAFRHLPFAQAGLALLLFGQTLWLPAFVERTFGVPRTQIGAAMALTQGLAIMGGGIFGGLVADRMALRDPLGPLRLIIISLVLGIVPLIGVYLARSVQWVYPLAASMTFLFAMPTGPMFSLLQTVVAPSLRATAAALSALVAALIGLGLGPLVIGVLSDHFISTGHGPESLRIAMLTTGAVVGPWALAHLLRLNHLLRSNLSPVMRGSRRVRTQPRSAVD